MTLFGETGNLGLETVNFALPLPPGLLSDARRAAVLDETGEEIPAAVRFLEPWRAAGKTRTGLRAIQIQLPLNFTGLKTRRLTIVINRARKKTHGDFVPVAQTLFEENGLVLPRVLAVLPADWLCLSLVAGPQTPAREAGDLAGYEALVERNFPGSLKFIDSKIYHEWLFDRTSAWYKMYVRTGGVKFLEAAYRAAHFLRRHTKMEGPDAGIFTLKGADLKYVYPRAMHLHYLFTGDEDALLAGRKMAEFCLKNHQPEYRADRLKPVALGVDPEKEREFWTLRHQGYGLLGILHGWEMTGEKIYFEKAVASVKAYRRHQKQPPDGRPPDGSLRQNWKMYDPNEAIYEGATSAWMMTLLLDPLFHYWTLSGDRRVPEIVLEWCDFLDRQGMVPDGSKAYYVINNFRESGPFRGEPGKLGPDMEMHNAEIAYTFAMGMFFTEPGSKRWLTYRKRFEQLFELAVRLDVNRPARAFNWTFQFTSQLVYFVKNSGRSRETLRKYLQTR
ncbi:MAG TPA: hypothetical protein VIL74_08135 [Pyrinomonadaceae bacterium]